MKILLSILVVLSIEAKSQTLKDTLLSIQYESYLNKPIDSLLQILPQSYDSVYTRSGSSIFVGAIVSVRYSSRNSQFFYTIKFYIQASKFSMAIATSQA